MCALVTTKCRTGVHRLDNIMTVQLYNWSKQSVWSASLKISMNGPSKVCALVTTKNKVYTDPIGFKNGLWSLQCLQRNLEFSVIESMVDHRDCPGQGNPPLAAAFGIIWIYLRRKHHFISCKIWDLLTFICFPSCKQSFSDIMFICEKKIPQRRAYPRQAHIPTEKRENINLSLK